ncbi:hypothetical protein [Pseudoduganella flava]|uniref:Uncharacterized protein n=1 Tax=Pseudoduganella flava TaxID=871742 RepID=A0ABX6FK98_9BURK|nr:hypothetical protein [Pseudoduganella flava]QGZ37680.1 hypothetical protein GO485_00480 [Pseudoduganella flava]
MESLVSAVKSGTSPSLSGSPSVVSSGLPLPGAPVCRPALAPAATAASAIFSVTGCATAPAAAAGSRAWVGPAADALAIASTASVAAKTKH